MTKLFFAIIATFILSSTVYADVKTDANLPNSKTVRLACGLSKDVRIYLSATGPTSTEVLPTLSDEHARYYFSYADGSWLIAIEYFSQSSPNRNMTCIVDKGEKETAIRAIYTRHSELPHDVITAPAPRS